MAKKKRTKPWSTIINAFISHRCEEYDEISFQQGFKRFLLRNRIRPRYGCKLDYGNKGILDKNIPLAMEECKIYIAFATPSWENVSTDTGWPMREWRIWQDIHKDKPDIMNNCIGFKYNVNFHNIPYIKNLVFYTVDFSYDKKSYPPKKHPNKRRLFGGYKACCWVLKNEYPLIKNAITDMHLIARKY
jgi:hypothetical protein